MNSDTRRIMKLLQVDAIEAVKLQEMMAEGGVDFSECSNADFNRAAKAAHRELHTGVLA